MNKKGNITLKNLARSASVTAFLLIISKILGFAREVFLADCFGTTYIADAYVIAKVDNKRGAQADTLAALFRKYTDRPVYREDTLADAFTRALNEKGSEGKLYCLGSLYLVGELKELIGGKDA